MARSKTDFKEYSRLRDIVVKRNKRAYEAGLMPQVHFPTVREIKSGVVTEAQARRYVEEYYSSGSQVRAIRETGITPEVKKFQELPPADKSETAKQKRRKEQQRLYRQRQRIRAHAPSSEKAERYERFLKGVRSFANKFIEAGMTPPFDPSTMTPKEAQAFAEYMDYRFSQGDYTQTYFIDEFIMDYAKLRTKHDPSEIISDYEKFVENRLAMEQREEDMEGLDQDEANELWERLANAKKKSKRRKKK